MSSQMKGKDQIKQWVMATIPFGSTCLDVGACDGVWWNLLHEHLRMDAIEVWVPNIETHHLLDKYGAVFGVGGWPGNDRDYVSENTYREVHLSGSKEILIHIHPDPINFVQTDEPYRGFCRPWGILMKKFPKKLLKLEVKRFSSFSAAFRGKKTNGSYYLIDLVADAGTAPADCLSVNVEELLGKEEQNEQDDKLDVYCDNMTIYEYLEQEENQDD